MHYVIMMGGTTLAFSLLEQKISQSICAYTKPIFHPHRIIIYSFFSGVPTEPLKSAGGNPQKIVFESPVNGQGNDKYPIIGRIWLQYPWHNTSMVKIIRLSGGD